MYLKKLSVETWEYVNRLTHAKNAVRVDAEVGLKAVAHLLGVFTAARLRLGWMCTRCPTCGSYQVSAGVCGRCEWADPDYERPQPPELSDEKLARRLAEPCTPDSDIATFAGPEDVRA